MRWADRLQVMGTACTKFQPVLKRIRTLVNDPADEDRYGGIEHDTTSLNETECFVFLAMLQDRKGPYIRTRNQKKYRLSPRHTAQWDELRRTDDPDLTIHTQGEMWFCILMKHTTEVLFQRDRHASLLDEVPASIKPEPGKAPYTFNVQYARKSADDHLISNRCFGGTFEVKLHTTPQCIFLETSNTNVFCLHYQDMSELDAWKTMKETNAARCEFPVTFCSSACIRFSHHSGHFDFFLHYRAPPTHSEFKASTTQNSMEDIILFEDARNLPCIECRTRLFRIPPADPMEPGLTEPQKRTWSRIFAEKTINPKITSHTSHRITISDPADATPSLEFHSIQSIENPPSLLEHIVEVEIAIHTPADLSMGKILFGEIIKHRRHFITLEYGTGNVPFLQTRNRNIWKLRPQDKCTFTARLWDIFKMDPDSFIVKPPTLATIQLSFMRLAMREVEDNMFIDFYLDNSRPRLAILHAMDRAAHLLILKQ